MLQWPLGVVGLIPGLVMLVLAYLVFKPTVPRLFVSWIVGFAGYLAIHAVLSVLFGVTFRFAVWIPG